MHYHVETNPLICLIKGPDRAHLGGFQSSLVATRNSAALLLESSLLNIDISLTTIYTKVLQKVSALLYFCGKR